MKAIYSERVVLENEITAATILVKDGKIHDIHRSRLLTKDLEMDDFGKMILFPGFIDTHVHINEPGRTDWEGFETATKAAALGGITSLVDMPLNCLPTTTSELALHEKIQACKGQLHVDCGFWGGLIPGNTTELEPMMKAGALGFKTFLIDSGIPEFPPTTESDLRKAMPILAAANKPLLVHAELETSPSRSTSSNRYLNYLASRPKDWENAAIRLMIRLARETKCHVHIVHLSSADALIDIERAKEAGIPITVETCPHYLCLAAEEIPDGDARYKCSPPIRERENQNRLWEGLRSGVIDFIVSDHSPCTPALKKLKERDLASAWGGISSLSFALPLLWSSFKARDFGFHEISKWLSSGPAKLAGWKNSKGQIAKGFLADLTAFDENSQWSIHEKNVPYKHPLSPYLGRQVQGGVQKTLLRGKLIQSEHRLLDDYHGKILV